MQQNVSFPDEKLVKSTKWPVRSFKNMIQYYHRQPEFNVLTISLTVLSNKSINQSGLSWRTNL